jgi:hypothetical protein
VKSDDDKEEEQQEEVEATAVLGWQLVVSRIVRLLLEKRTLSDRNRVLSKATCSLERGKAAEGKMWGRGVAFFSKKCFSSLCVLESLARSRTALPRRKKKESAAVNRIRPSLCVRSLSSPPFLSFETRNHERRRHALCAHGA